MSSIADRLNVIAENQQKVYDAGKTAEWNEFWDKFQRNGKLKYYPYLFRGYNWSPENFYPKYDIIIEGDATQMFYAWADYNTDGFDFKRRLNQCGITLDTSGITRVRQMFAITNFTNIPALDLTGCSGQALTYHQNVFNGSKKLKTIDSITVNEGNYFDGWFSNCTSLENITIIGSIAHDFDIHNSIRLSKDSILSILRACNVDVTESPVTIVFPSCYKDGKTIISELFYPHGDNPDTYEAKIAAQALGYNIAW